MIRKTIYETEGKRKLASGIRLLCETLTMEGRILVEGSFSYSAMMVAKNLEGSDLWENQGIRLAADAIAEINTRTGCGTAGAASMMLELLKSCERQATAGNNPIRLARELKIAATELAEQIHEGANPAEHSRIELLDEILQDTEQAELLAKAMDAGDVVIKESMELETRLEITKGLSMDIQMLCGNKVALSGVKVLVVDGEIADFKKLLPILEKLQGQSLFIVCEDIRGEALTLLRENVRKGRLYVWAVKAPGIGRRKADLLGDLAVLTKATLVHGPLLDQTGFSMEMLGLAEKIQITEKKCVVKGTYEGGLLEDRIQKVKARLQAPETNYYDQQILRERLASLRGAVPIVYVGGLTRTQVKEEKLRMEYATAYGQTVEQYGMYEMEDLWKTTADTLGMELLLESMKVSFQKEQVSACLLSMTIRKVAGMVCMWLTTGAVMVSIEYDREDLELMRNGVDVDHLRGMA